MHFGITSCFSHGHLYVALSRATNPENVFVLTGDGDRLTRNVVHWSLATFNTSDRTIYVRNSIEVQQVNYRFDRMLENAKRWLNSIRKDDGLQNWYTGWKINKSNRGAKMQKTEMTV